MNNKFHVPKWILITIIITAFIGFVDATYLTVEHYDGSAIKCRIFEGCETVTNSEYAVIFGIPLALLGAIYYFGMLFLGMLYLDIKKKPILYLLILGGIAGVLASGVLVYAQIFLLEAICEYCILSALTSTTLFVCGMFIWRKISRPTLPS